jgi:hypothetical protein
MRLLCEQEKHTVLKKRETKADITQNIRYSYLVKVVWNSMCKE